MSLDLAAIRDSNGQETTDLDVPELGGTIRIRMMSGTDQFRLEERRAKHKDDWDSHTRLVFIACIIDDDGKPIFDGRSVGVLMDKPGHIVNRVAEQIMDFCAHDIDDAEKKSEPMTT